MKRPMNVTISDQRFRRKNRNGIKNSLRSKVQPNNTWIKKEKKSLNTKYKFRKSMKN